MNSELRLKRPGLPMLAAALLAAVLFSFAVAAGNDFGYETAARLSAEKKHDEALAVLTEGLKQAEASNDTRLAFFLARNLSSCHERLGNLTAWQPAHDARSPGRGDPHVSRDAGTLPRLRLDRARA